MHQHISIVTAALSAAGFLICLGCGHDGGPDRAVISGAVTFAGKPLEEGRIMFVPAKGTKGPTSGAEIVGGKYTVKAKGGVPLGTHRVEITAFRQLPIPPGVPESAFDQGPPREQFIPAKYNRQSELKIEILPDGSREFNFDLQ